MHADGSNDLLHRRVVGSGILRGPLPQRQLDIDWQREDGINHMHQGIDLLQGLCIESDAHLGRVSKISICRGLCRQVRPRLALRARRPQPRHQLIEASAGKFARA